jgi:hypothetical protein
MMTAALSVHSENACVVPGVASARMMMMMILIYVQGHGDPASQRV